jgi:hypothetical protein
MIMTTASTILKIDELPTKDIHYHIHFTGNGDTSLKSNHSKGSFDYLKTMLFDITYRPTDGLTASEIKRITDFVLNSDKILYYSMGVEVKGGKIKTCHLHIHVVMKTMCRNGDIGKMFEPLMKGERVAPKPDIALKVTTCKRNEVQNKTVLLHSVYPLKDAARDKAAHEITPEHWNNRITTWTNIFDGKKDCMGDELDWWKWKEDRFKHLLFKKFHTNHKETITITSGNAVRMIKEYASKKNIPYSLNQRAAIIAEMVTDTTDTVNYEETIIKGKAKTAINGIKEEDHYKPSLLKLLQDHYDKGDELLGRIVEETRSPADIETINALTRQIAKLEKMNEKLEKWCKRHVAEKQDIKNIRREINYHEREYKRIMKITSGRRTLQDHDALYLHRDELVRLRKDRLAISTRSDGIDDNEQVDERECGSVPTIEPDDCLICLTKCKDPVLGCGHLYHENCVVQFCRSGHRTSCPTCRQKSAVLTGYLKAADENAVDEEEEHIPYMYDKVATCNDAALKARYPQLTNGYPNITGNKRQRVAETAEDVKTNMSHRRQDKHIARMKAAGHC